MFMIAGALSLCAAAPAPTFVPWKDGEGLLVPADSPVQFDRIDENYTAHFKGQFLVSGTYVLDCEYCEPGAADNQLRLSIVPDSATRRRLPKWKKDRTDMKLFIVDGEPLIRSISTPAERARLFAGSLRSIKGSTSIIVEDFETTIECDSASFSARFVAIAKEPKRSPVRPSGNFGCGEL